MKLDRNGSSVSRIIGQQKAENVSKFSIEKKRGAEEHKKFTENIQQNKLHW